MTARLSLLTLSVLVLLPASAYAQSVDAILMGTVATDSGAVVPGANVTARALVTDIVRDAVAGADGRYVFLNLPPGPYTVLAALDGFAPANRTQTLHVGTTITINFVLTVAGGAETVTVQGPLAAIEPTKNSLTRIVQNTELDTLPVINRNFNDLAALAPGVTKTGVYGGVDISGSRDFQNAYQLDGVSAERQHLGDQRTAYAQDWIEEFQVLTSQFNAEFGQAAGGVLNVITRSGGNQNSGRVNAFFRNEAWDALPTFAARKPPLDQRRIGGTAGGPVVSNRIFYFAGIERMRSASSNIVNSSFAPANGTFPATDEQTLWLGKVEAFLNPSHNVRLRHNGQRQEVTGSSIGGISTEEHGRFSKVRAQDVVGGWTWVISPSTLNEARSAWSTVVPEGGCNLAARNPPGTWFELAYPAAQFGCPVNFGTIAEDQFQFIDNLLWTRGRHDVKIGVHTSWTRSAGDFRNFRDGRYSFERDVAFSQSDPSTHPFSFVMIEGPTIWNVPAWSAGMFVQDNWRMTEAVTLNLGVRYDLDTSLTALNPLVRVDKGLHTMSADADNIAPRMGVAWTPFRDDKRTLLRGGAGLYYDQNHNNVATTVLLNNILVDRAVTLNANSPLLNPFWPDISRAKSFLAEALARNSIPDASRLGTIAAGTNDVDPNLRIPSTTQVSGGVVREFSRWLNVSADVVYAHGRDLYIIRNTNLDPTTLRTINPSYTSINSFGNGGLSRYRALQLQTTVIPSASRFLKLAYTLAANRGNTNTTLSGGAATNPFDDAEDDGPSDNDVRHNLTVNGSSTLPLGLQVSGIVSFRSALPYSATTTAPRPDGKPFGFRPEPRNARRGDTAVSLDVRLGKRIALGRRHSATAFLESFNVTNHVNYSQYTGTITSSQFGRPATAGPPRLIQLGFRIDF